MKGIVYLFIIIFGTVIAQSYDEMDELQEDLFNSSRYNKLLRPLQNQSHAMQVNFTKFVTSIESFDIQSGELLVAGYFKITWVDEFLRWNPSNYSGKKLMPLPKEKIWKPELSQFTVSGDHGNLIDTSGFSPTWATYQGHVLVVPAGRYKTRCNVDTRLFPFDTHHCSFQYYVSNHDATELTLYSVLDKWDTTYMKEHGEWMITNEKTSIVVINEEDFGDLALTWADVTFTLKRRPAFEMVNTFAPVVLMTFLNILTCFIRPDSGERLSFAVTLYLSLVFVSTALTERFPNNSLKMPYMSYRILIFNLINTMSTAWSVFIVRLAGTSTNTNLPIPGVVLKYLLKNIDIQPTERISHKISPDKSETGVTFMERQPSGEKKDATKYEENSEKETKTKQMSGIEAAKTLDKLFFYFVFLLFVAIDSVFFAVMIYYWDKS